MFSSIIMGGKFLFDFCNCWFWNSSDSWSLYSSLRLSVLYYPIIVDYGGFAWSCSWTILGICWFYYSYANLLRPLSVGFITPLSSLSWMLSFSSSLLSSLSSWSWMWLSLLNLGEFLSEEIISFSSISPVPLLCSLPVPSTSCGSFTSDSGCRSDIWSNVCSFWFSFWFILPLGFLGYRT